MSLVDEEKEVVGDLHLEDLVGVLLLELSDQRTACVLDEPVRKINLGSKKQVMSSIVDRVESSKMTRPSKAVSSSEAEEIDLEEEGVIESVDESSFNLVCPQNQEGFWVTFDKSLLDTFHAGFCFSLTNDGQV